jgi:protein SCO1/2
LKAKILTIFVSLILSACVLWAVVKINNSKPEIGGYFKAQNNGQDWTFKDDPKDLNLLFIGYVKCPDICPMTLSFINKALGELELKDKSRVRFIFLSVDQNHVSAQDVSSYVKQFNSSFIGLNGTKNQIDQIVTLFNLTYKIENDPKSYLGYSITHSDRILFLNKLGIVISQLPSPLSSDEILKKIRENL